MNIILGALTADAASLGLHWIYDFPHLQKIAGRNPEFKTIDSKNYEGVFSFFAHGTKKSGDFSHYGETLLVYLKSQLSAPSLRIPNLRSYQSLYRDTFGMGGSFVGYIDNPTRITLENLHQYELEAVEEAKKIAQQLPPDIAKVVVQKVLPYTRKYSGDDLRIPVTRAIQITYSQPEVLETALVIAKAVDEKKKLNSGADDEQCPAWASLPALCYFGEHLEEEALLQNAEKVIRVTNNSDAAIPYVHFAIRFLRQLMQTKSLESAFAHAHSKAPTAIQALTEKAWNSKNKNLEEVSAELGRTCYLKEALPLSLYILKNTKSYKEAVRMNILAGGDSCGRSMLVGAAATALYGTATANGLDLTWILKLNRGVELSEILKNRDEET